jgi:hypothetical protein
MQESCAIDISDVLSSGTYIQESCAIDQKSLQDLLALTIALVPGLSAFPKHGERGDP